MSDHAKERHGRPKPGFRLRPHAALCVAACVLLPLTACDCLHTNQFQIAPTAGRTAAPQAKDIEEVCRVLRASAAEFGFEERTNNLGKGVFCSFSERTNNLPFAHRALWFQGRASGDRLLIDASLYNPGCKGKRRHLFAQFESSLGARLTNSFGDRVIAVPRYQDRVPLERSWKNK